MARPRCFECGKALVYMTGGKGKTVHAIYIDPIGNEHKLHKDCFKHGGYAVKTLTASLPQPERTEP